MSASAVVAEPKGRYRSSANGDGTFNVHGLEIFTEIPAGARNNKQPIGREWMQRAVDRAKARESQDYLGPVHFRHHLPGQPASHAGMLRLTHVGKMPYEGESRWHIFADLVRVPAEMFERIQRGELRYRSVEIHNWDVPEINSLALLDSEVPYLRFGMTTVSEPEPSGALFREWKTRQYDRSKAGALRMLSVSGETSVALFKFSEDGMPNEETHAGDQQTDHSPEGTNKGAEMAEDTTATDETGDVAPAADPADMDDQEASAGVPSWVATMMQTLERIAAAVITPDDAAKTGGAPGGPAEPMGVPQNTMSDGPDVAALSAKIDSLTARMDAKRAEDDAAKAVTDRVERAHTELEGYHLTSDMRASIQKFAAMGDDEIGAYIESAKQNGIQDPPTLNDLEAHGEGTMTVEDAQAIARFSAYGPATMERAQAAVALFHEVKKQKGFALSLDRFLETQVQVPSQVS